MSASEILESARYYVDETKYALTETALRKLVAGLSKTDATLDIDLVEVSELLEESEWVGELGLRWLDHHLCGCPGVSVFPGGLADGGADVIKTGLVFRNSAFAVALQAFDSLMLRTVRASLRDASLDVILGRSSVLRVVSNGVLVCQLTEYHEVKPNQDFDEIVEKDSSTTIRLDRESGPLRISGKRHAIRFLDSENDPLVLNVTSLVDALPFRLHVARSTGAIVSVFANDEADNIVRTMMTVLRQLNAHERVGVLQRYANHPTHFVRWHALRELALLQPEIASQALDERLSVEPSDYMRRNLTNLYSHIETGKGC